MITWVPLTITIAGLFLILLGAYMSIVDWNEKHRLEIRTEQNSLDKTISALEKLLVALKDYPTGAQMIVFGIILLFIGGLSGGAVALGALG